MRRPTATVARIVLVALAAAITGAGLTGCRSAASTPTIATVDFTPKAEIVVDDHGLLVVHGVGSTVDPTTLAAGSVVTIGNDDADDQRVTGTLDGKPSIDTGTLRTGQQVTVVLATPGTLVLGLGPDGRGQPTTITVTPPS